MQATADREVGETFAGSGRYRPRRSPSPGNSPSRRVLFPARPASMTPPAGKSPDPDRSTGSVERQIARQASKDVARAVVGGVVASSGSGGGNGGIQGNQPGGSSPSPPPPAVTGVVRSSELPAVRLGRSPEKRRFSMAARRTPSPTADPAATVPVESAAPNTVGRRSELPAQRVPLPGVSPASGSAVASSPSIERISSRPNATVGGGASERLPQSSPLARPVEVAPSASPIVRSRPRFETGVDVVRAPVDVATAPSLSRRRRSDSDPLFVSADGMFR